MGRRGWEYWTVPVEVPPGTSGRPLDEDAINVAVAARLRELAIDGWIPNGPAHADALAETGSIEVTRISLRDYVTGVRITVKRRVSR